MWLPTRGAKVAGKYELVEEIGRGGMGVVWRAYAESLGLHCALKMVLPSAGRERERSRLLREARIAAKLRSPYIVSTYDVGEWQGCAFIAMELLEGQTLSNLLALRGRFAPAFTLHLMRQLALGLEKAHAAGLVHRDLKPDNIFVVESEPLLVKLLDFGVAKQFTFDSIESTQLQSAAGAIIGTPRYMSPEQAQGAAQVDYRTDLWALAVIAYECLTGEAPFHGETFPQLLLKVCVAPLPVPSQHAPVPAGFDAFWLSAAARSPSQRPASARAFADQLRHALATAPGVADEPAAPVSDISVERLPSRRVWLGVLLAGAAAVGGSVVYFADEPPPAAPAKATLVLASEQLEAVSGAPALPVPSASTSEPGAGSTPSLPAASPPLEAATTLASPVARPAAPKRRAPRVASEASPATEVGKPELARPKSIQAEPTSTNGGVDDDLGF